MMITQNNSKYFEQILLAMKYQILELDKTSEESKKPVLLDQSSIGRVSRVDAIQQQQMAEASSRRRLLKIKKIEIALNKIKLNEFGICIECGDDIALGRLEIDPTYTKCVNCA